MKPPTPPLFTDHDPPSGKKLTPRRLFANAGPWGGSALVHGILLLILLLWTLPILQSGQLQLTAFTGADEGDIEELSFALEDTVGADLQVDEDEPLPPTDFTVADPLMDPPAELMLDQTTPQIEITETGPLAATQEETAQPSRSGGAVSEANSVEAAVDQITGGIQGRLENGDVLVVWLLDASLSLQDDRRRVAERLSSFLTVSGTSSGKGHRLLNAVATFGRNFKEEVSPTEQSKPILHRIKNASIDRSGDENVFTAVEKAVAKYRKRWKSQMMIVVWTDESGDDVGRLEKSIVRCQKGKVAVSVVGPSAVLGADTALHDYVDPQTQQYHQLPIRKGPDSVMPERIRLSYWFRGPPPREVRRTSNRPFPIWYGNDDLIGLTSSFSPHALTRLASETGGSFTIFDRAEDQAPYDQQRMEAYRPTYETTRAYSNAVSDRPLRRAVHNAVKVSYSHEIATPDLMFFGIRNPQPPHAIQPLYFTPAQFRTKLRSTKGKIQRQITKGSYAIEKALTHVSGDDVETGLEYEYNQEDALRWRAWYDLTRGRLLAVSVRFEEYRLAFDDLLKTDLRNTTNGLICGPSNRIRSTGRYAKRAEEAERLLMRCMREHADTPWAYLAQRELNHGLGIRLKQMTFQLTGEMKKGGGAKLPSY